VSEISTATPDRGRDASDGGRAATGGKDSRPGAFARLRLFLRQVVAELRKVIWPTRKELVTYTTVVVVFVSAVALIVALYDLVFTKLVFWVFGTH